MNYIRQKKPAPAISCIELASPLTFPKKNNVCSHVHDNLSAVGPLDVSSWCAPAPQQDTVCIFLQP